MSCGRNMSVAVALWLGCGSAAFAADEDCAVVAKAMIAGGSQLSGRQTEISLQSGAPLGLSVILTPDATHARESADSPWKTVPYGVATRMELSMQALEDFPVSGCSKLPPETIRGVATEVYGYTQRNPMTPEAETMAGRIWIAPNGLPLRVKMTERSALDYEYGDFPAPDAAGAAAKP